MVDAYRVFFFSYLSRRFLVLFCFVFVVCCLFCFVLFICLPCCLAIFGFPFLFTSLFLYFWLMIHLCYVTCMFFDMKFLHFQRFFFRHLPCWCFNYNTNNIWIWTICGDKFDNHLEFLKYFRSGVNNVTYINFAMQCPTYLFDQITYIVNRRHSRLYDSPPLSWLRCLYK